MRRWIIAGVALAVVAGGAYAAFLQYRIYLPGLLMSLREPVLPNQPVAWEAGPATPAAAPADRPPNIVLIVADDLGANDLTYAGGGVANGAVPTPRIDSLARDGGRLASGYAAHATCSPSRAAMMTGRYPQRFGFEFTSAPVAFARTIFEFTSAKGTSVAPARYFAEREAEMPPLETLGLPPSEITIAELLKTRGYRTLLLGKWHLGETPELQPEAQGFDESLAFYPGAQMFLRPDDPNVVNAKQDFDPIDSFLWANLPFGIRKNGGQHFAPDKYMTDYLAEQAAAAIAANRNRPFFITVAFNAPHTPLQALKEDYDALPQIQDHTLRVYAAMIRALDRGVGTVLDALEQNGLSQNTIVIFTTDNGGANYVGLPDLNKPYRGWKATFFEGGVNVPFFVRWPAKIPAGSVARGPGGHLDVFATAAAAAGAALPADRPIDSVDLVPFFTGQAQTPVRTATYFRSGHYRAMIDGGWKLQVSERPERVWLFDLNSDPTEQTDLSAQQPERVAALRKILDDFESKNMVKPMWPALIEAPIRIDVPLNAPAKPDDPYVYWAN